MSRVIIVRHAQSEANREGGALGRLDSPLTELGRQQAEAVGDALQDQNIAKIVASPLSRAASTAAAIAGPHGLAGVLDDRLMEMDVGLLDGLPFAEAREKHGDFLKQWMGTDADALPMPGGESMVDVADRAWPALEPLLAAEAEPGEEPDGITVVVSHNFVIKALICCAIELELRFWRRFEVDLASRSTLARRRGQVALYALNDTSHLGHGLRP
jgi:broad specificity phosphatase PhoE